MTLYGEPLWAFPSVVSCARARYCGTANAARLVTWLRTADRSLDPADLKVLARVAAARLVAR